MRDLLDGVGNPQPMKLSISDGLQDQKIQMCQQPELAQNGSAPVIRGRSGRCNLIAQFLI
jgi:hypothetical protein